MNPPTPPPQNAFPSAARRSLLPTALLLATLLLAAASPLFAADKKAPPPRPAAEYAAFDFHPNEHVTVAADPCDTPADCPFFRLPYIEHGFLPIRIIITNDTAQSLSLEDARMQFLSASGEKVPAALPEDLQRRIILKKSTTIPLPSPLPNITIHHPPVDKKILEDDHDFGFPATTVEPHSTLAGYLFYDVRGIDDPVLKSAELIVRQVHTTDNRTQLFGFTIPFDKWLAEHAAHPLPEEPRQKKPVN